MNIAQAELNSTYVVVIQYITCRDVLLEILVRLL